MAFKFKNPWAADEFVNPWDINGAEAQKVLGDDRSIALDDSKESLSNPPTKEELKRKYDSPSVYSWQGYANDFSEVKIVSTFETVAQKYINLPPSYLYTYAIGEGLNAVP